MKIIKKKFLINYVDVNKKIYYLFSLQWNKNNKLNFKNNKLYIEKLFFFLVLKKNVLFKSFFKKNNLFLFFNKNQFKNFLKKFIENNKIKIINVIYNNKFLNLNNNNLNKYYYLFLKINNNIYKKILKIFLNLIFFILKIFFKILFLIKNKC